MDENKGDTLSKCNKITLYCIIGVFVRYMRGIDEHSLRLHQAGHHSGLVPESEGEVEEGILYCPLSDNLRPRTDRQLAEDSGVGAVDPKVPVGTEEF